MHALLLSLVLSSAPPAQADIPDVLRPWIPWVLHNNDVARCPKHDDDTVCLWPGPLSLVVNAKGGTFDVTITALINDLEVPLPGSDDAWPQGVLVDGKRAVVLDTGVPTVRLAAGEHKVTGRFVWDEQPDALTVPEDYALVSLTLRGRPVPFPRRQGDSVSLERDEGQDARDDDTIDLAIVRRIYDDAPLVVETRFLIDVAGKAREVSLPGALLAGFEAASVSSTLPARLDGARLRVQVRPGSHTVTIMGRAADQNVALKAPVVNDDSFDDGPPEEIWVYQAVPALRIAHVDGAMSVAPEQTRLPKEWQRFPAYRLGPGEGLKLVEDRRGDADPPKSRLTIARQVWLDFDGNGATVRDVIRGTFNDARLEMGKGTTLGHVKSGGKDGTITTLAAGGAPGVEVRERQLDVTAESRIDKPLPQLPAVSWLHDFQGAELTLHLPPGFSLLHASGVDSVSDTWLKRWSLFEIFLVVVLAAAILRLWGPVPAVASALCFILTFQEKDAPMTAWVVVVVLAGLHRALPEAWRHKTGVRFLAWLRVAVAVITGLIVLDFATEQVRRAMYPVLEYPYQRLDDSGHYRDGSAVFGKKSMAPPPPPPIQAQQQMEEPDYDRVGDAIVDSKESDATVLRKIANAAPSGSGSSGYGSGMGGLGSRSESTPKMPVKMKAKRQVITVDPSAYAQTGPGLPTWSWRQVTLTFSGPVQHDQQIGLTVTGPAVNLALAFARVLLLAFMVLCAFGAPGALLSRLLPRMRGRGAIWLSSLLLPLSLMASTNAQAETPSYELLDELRDRLLEQPPCIESEACATIAAVDLDANAQSLRVRLELHAQVNTTTPIPGDSEQWLPRTVIVDGKAAGVIMRDGVLLVRTDAGVHDVVLEGPLPPLDSVQLSFPLVPKRGAARTSGWTVDGIHDDGSVDGNIQLSRTERTQRDDSLGALAPAALPPFLRVERTLLLGLTFETEVRIVRLSPMGTPIVVDVPLLPGESVTTDGVRTETKDGKAVAKVNLGPTDSEVFWHASLSQAPSIKLQAPSGVPWLEQWQLQESPLWHVEKTGIPPVHDPTETQSLIYRPWPGESLALSLTRPQTVAGQTQTIDSVKLDVTPGLRSTTANLDFVVRSSRGGQHVVTLPAGAELLSATVNGTKQPLRQESGKVTVPLVPGSQRVVLETRIAHGITVVTSTPTFDIGGPATNITTVVTMPDSRWTLFAWGPRAGPAVLFWSFLLVTIAVAMMLSRVPHSPLKAHQWVLLSLGLTQVPVAVAAIVAGWLLALGFRAQPVFTDRERLHPFWFDIVQLTLVGWTLTALGIFVGSIHEGLLGSPDMLIEGNGSSSELLRWFADRTTTSTLPTARVWSVPLLVYRLSILAWSLWLATALLRWLAQGFRAFGAGGYFRDPFPRKTPPPTTETASVEVTKVTLPEAPENAPTSAAAMSDPTSKG